MDRITTISNTTISDTTVSDTTRAHPSAGAPGTCWCGQDFHHVRTQHCPRCGTARAPHIVTGLSRLAA